MVHYGPGEEHRYAPGCGPGQPERPRLGLPLEPKGLLKLISNRELPQRATDNRFLISTEWINGRRVPPASIEVRVSQELLVDCNIHQLQGSLEPATPSSNHRGHYSFWRVSERRGAITTMMACPPNEPQRRLRVYLNQGQPTVIAWNGRTTVVDLPKGWALEWRRAGSLEPFRFERPL